MTERRIEIFSYPEERAEIMTVDIDGDVWFAAVDVCNILGLPNPTDSLKTLDDDEKLTYELHRAGQLRKVNLLNESGLYALIFRSRKESAQQFRKWVTKEVLPSIRKNGYYHKDEKAGLPKFCIRYRDNIQKIDRNYFSVIGELFITLYSEFEKVGYIIPDKGYNGHDLYPDISVGRTFSDYLKRTDSEYKNTHKTYTHTFPDSRQGVDARMYPVEVLPVFRKFVYNVWFPQYAHKYFQERDPVALDYLPKLLPEYRTSALTFGIYEGGE